MRGERIVWTPEEDEFLRKAVQKYGDKTEKWAKIAACVPGRTNKNCRKRWFHSLDPSLRKGGWTVEEDHLLRTGVEKFRGQWSKIAERIPGRTDDQCAKRWRESLDPHIDRGAWTPEDDLLLLEKFKEYGTQWQKIAAISFPGRPGLHCRNRWRKIQRSLNQIDRSSKRRRNQSDLSDRSPIQNTISTPHTNQSEGSVKQSPKISKLSSEETLMQETYLDDDCDLLEDNTGDIDDINDSNSDEEKPYGCAIPDCMFECSTPSLLFYHFKASHHGTTILKPFRCTMPGCEERKRYKNINGLQYHVNYAKNTPGHSGHSTSYRENDYITKSGPVTPADEDTPLISNDAIEGSASTALVHPSRASLQALTTPAEIQSLIPSTASAVPQQIVSHQAFNIPNTPESSVESSPISRDLTLPQPKSTTQQCPELGCGQIFRKLNDLTSHMAKNHGHQSMTMESNDVAYGQDSISIPEGDLDGVGIDMDIDMDMDMELAYFAQGHSSPAADNTNNLLFLDDTVLQAHYESLTRDNGSSSTDLGSFSNTGTTGEMDILAMNKLLFANHMSYMLNTAINSNPYSNRVHFGTHINVRADDPFTLPSTPVTSANVSPRIMPAAINIPADSNGNSEPMTHRNHPSTSGSSVFSSMQTTANNNMEIVNAVNIANSMSELMMERSKSFGGGAVSAHINLGSSSSSCTSAMPTPESLVSPGSPDSVTTTLYRGNTNNGIIGLMDDLSHGMNSFIGNGKQKQAKRYEDHEKPFKCLVPGCGKGYKNINGLRNHLLQAHGSTPKRKVNSTSKA
ncbi:hypothetical protein BGZ76_002156 [Entomortierella beljakovae]|nr:hypothetical protein BGZ76_002156 [Entomortierella beljakovae]